MHQFYHAVRTSEGEESGEQLGKTRLIIYIFVVQCGRGDLTVRTLDRLLIESWTRLDSSVSLTHHGSRDL